ncbi:hypothetical protein A3844_29075 [Paenibacillus helianthi]|uniref:Lipid II:glycine glycyltransferase n=1 Tax=Paenibacillus helianthi TaxID=1349432 RepID=A0ABX3EER5_9BACL|nr:hypothetical protein A3844_29075 [Paenibacillus helianthi]
MEIFYEEFNNYCIKENIVSEFVRFHPLIHDKEIYTKFMDVQTSNMNIYLDFDDFNTEEELLKSYKHSNRKSIKKAMQNGVSIIIDTDLVHFNEFFDIYNHTMNRNEADKFYYFSAEFFESINKMRHNVVYFHAVYQNKIISTELLLFDGNCIYSFLGGTLSEYFQVCPNNLLKHKVSLWAKEKGIRYFLLGGGYTANDGIFNYKKSFAPLNEVPFFVGKKIHNKYLYDLLCSLRNMSNPNSINNYFPQYRNI